MPKTDAGALVVDPLNDDRSVYRERGKKVRSGVGGNPGTLADCTVAIADRLQNRRENSYGNGFLSAVQL